MIVTRTWLEEFIDLSKVGDEKLCETFNSIGLEVDSYRKIEIPEKVVVGRILSCEKHPDADKLNLCRVDVGTGEPLQIVCGAANVREAEFVAVATVGAVLPGDFAIKPAKLRGVESFGMICSSTELGLPAMEEGIWILDESLGEMIPGRQLREYPLVADSVIELELTANRGDCLSIRGVARDLSAALDRPLREREYRPERLKKRGIARAIDLHCKGEIDADLFYVLAEPEEFDRDALLRLRLALTDNTKKDKLEEQLAYATQETGVILRAYDSSALKNAEGKIPLSISQKRPGYVEVRSGEKLLSLVGIRQEEAFKATQQSAEVLLEASYVEPDLLVPAVAEEKPETDALYYRSSRGSEPDLSSGMASLFHSCDLSGACSFSDTDIEIQASREPRIVTVDTGRLNAVIGEEISRSTILGILKRLGFGIRTIDGEIFAATVPPWRHDIVNLQDVAEEILRIVGINRIEAKPLQITEADRLSESTRRFRIKRDLRQRAVAAGYFEAVTYAFADKAALERYGFAVMEESVALLNPIVEEFNTLRSTLTINLLDAAKRNVSYGKRKIPLFEIGSVFDTQRKEREKLAFLWSGEAEEPRVTNHGKPPRIDFARFVETLGDVLGDFRLTPAEELNGLMHPYQSATLYLYDRPAGWVSKLHPAVAEAYGLEETFLAELDFDALIPPHRNAGAISNFQGTWKDLSVLVERTMPYERLAEAIQALQEPVLKRFFPVDIYEEESLGERKSVTIRFFLQSMEGTLSDEAIDGVMQRILATLENRCGARLR